MAIIGIISALWGCGAIGAGIGILKRAQWGRVLGLLLAGVAALLAILNLVAMNIVLVLTNGAYAGFSFAVLLQAKYKAEFA
jgi:hypothetical protein